jgi:hypothetical protein
MSTVGTTEGSNIPTIMTAHIKNIIRKAGTG